jgi:hypothetical protein
MTTLYNILIKPEIDHDVGEDLALSCFIAAKGFLGKKHVNQVGRVFPGYDPGCETYHEGHFDIFNRQHRPLHQILAQEKKRNVFLSADEQDMLDDILQESTPWQGLLERLDPAVMIYPWDQYMDARIPAPFAIATPLGKQDSHVHLQAGGGIRYCKPSKDAHWYDFDVLRDLVFDAIFLESDLKDRKREARNLWERHIAIPAQLREVRRATRYEDALMTLEGLTRIKLPDDYRLPEVP